mgnify:CR=1 FL=1
MFWADEIAEEVINNYPDLPVYTCASGISPSGVVHMGNLREVVTSWFVVKALRDKGKKVRFIFSWDSFDRLRKIPKDADQSFSQYIGMPLDTAPALDGVSKSWARSFQQPFIDSLKVLGVEVEHIFQSEQYLSGRYADKIILAVKKRKEIYDIITSFKTQDADEGERENYYPLNVYCEKCGKDNTTITSEKEGGAVLNYECKCGYHGSIDLRKQHNAKLVWKVDWPMRWTVENVNFEPGGKDHSTEGGSYQVASVIVKKIFGGRPPVYRGYEWLGIKGLNGDMHSSKGGAVPPSVMLEVYTPEIVLWLFTRNLPEKAFDIALDDEVLRMYHEFDRMYAQYESGEADETVRRIIEMALSCNPNYKKCPVSAQNIASFAPIVNFDLDMLVKVLNKIGDKCTKEEIEERFNKISYWLKHYSPESISTLLEEKNTEFYDSLLAEEKGWISTLVEEINKKDLSLDEMQALLYEIPKLNGEQNKVRQKRFFEIVYNLLLGKNKGPRLYLFLLALNKSDLLKLLTF